MGDWRVGESGVLEGLLLMLDGLPDWEVCEGGAALVVQEHGLESDAVVETRVRGRDLGLIVEVKKVVYPRDVRQVLDRLRSYSKLREGFVPLLAAESISPGAKELLREEGVGYWDSGGSLFLAAPGVYVLIDRPVPKSAKRVMRTLFSGRRAHAILAILMRSDEWVGVAEIARLSGVSKPTVSQVMTELERQGFMVSQGAGPAKERRVESPGALLDTWVAELPSLRRSEVRRFFVPGLKAGTLADEVGAGLDSRGVTYGISGQAAAQRYAPFLSSFSVVAVRALESPGVREAIDALGGHEVDTGANLEVVGTKFADEFNFREEVDDLWLLSPIQVYLDLLQGNGRSQELADHLRRERIGF